MSAKKIEDWPTAIADPLKLRGLAISCQSTADEFSARVSRFNVLNFSDAAALFMSAASAIRPSETSLVKGTASAVPQRDIENERSSTLPKAGAKPEGRSDYSIADGNCQKKLSSPSSRYLIHLEGLTPADKFYRFSYTGSSSYKMLVIATTNWKYLIANVCHSVTKWGNLLFQNSVSIKTHLIYATNFGFTTFDIDTA
ncbi:MAG TPA: hypothetical protein VGG95_08465 [Edaphobacter sp.]